MRMKWFSLASVVLVASLGPVAADPPASTGKDAAAARVETAMAEHVEVLTGLVPQVPEPAREDVKRALALSRKTQEAVRVAFSGRSGGEVRPASSKDRPAQGSGRPETTGLQKALEAVSEGFTHSVEALNKARAEAGGPAAQMIGEALVAVQTHRQVAIENLNLLIAGERPEHAARPDRPVPPGKAAQPERPERPATPPRPH